MIKKITYAILWLSIGLISAIDVYWSIVLQEVLIETELNPVGQFLIRVSNGDVALFMFCKVMGLVVVLGILAILYSYKRRIAWYSIIGVAVFQFWLLWYLNAGDESTLQKAKRYHTEQQKEFEVLQFQPTTTPANPVDIYLKPHIDSTNPQNHAQSAEKKTFNKSTTTLP